MTHQIDHYAKSRANPNPFKVGDKVYCTHPNNELQAGREYVVSGYPFYEFGIKLEGVPGGFFHTRFVLAEQPKLSPEARKAQYYADRQAAYDAYAKSRREALGMAGEPLPIESTFLAGWDACRAWDKAKWDARLMGKNPMHAYPYGQGQVRTNDPSTSQEAAKSAKVGKLYERIINDLKANGPATAAGLAERLGEELNAVSPRMKRLVDQGWAKVHGAVSENGSRQRSLYSYNSQAEAYQAAAA